MNRFVYGSSVLAMVLVTSIAWADIAPPECSVEEYSWGGRVCESCEVSAGNSNICTERYAGTTFDWECSTNGGSSWTEVWCRDSSAADSCSVTMVSASELTCESCEASYESPELCSERYAGTDYAQFCTTDRMAYWTEVWCTDNSMVEPVVDTGGEVGGCYGAANGVPMRAWLAFLPVLALVFLRVRRHLQSRG